MNNQYVKHFADYLKFDKLNPATKFRSLKEFCILESQNEVLKRMSAQVIREIKSANFEFDRNIGKNDVTQYCQ